MAIALLGGCGGEGASIDTETSLEDPGATVSRTEDRQRAEEAVLKLSDLPAGGEWRVNELSEDEVVPQEIKCVLFNAVTPNLVVTASARGESFSTGAPILIAAGKPFPRESRVVTSAVTIYETDEQAQTAFQETVDRLTTRVGGCVLEAEKIEGGPALGQPTGNQYLSDAFPFAEETGGVTLKIPLKKDKEVVVYLDAVLMRQGRGLATVFFSSVQFPPVSVPFHFDELGPIARPVADRLAPKS